MGNSSDSNSTATMDPNPKDALDAVLSGVPEASELKRKSMRGGAAALINQGVATGLQLGTTLVLARLLSPTDYGLQAMVLTLTSFFSFFKDLGLSIAVIQRETLSREQISTLFWINVGLGFFLMLAVAAMAPLLADFYKDQRLVGITLASSTIFFINSLATQHRALLDRAMRFTTGMKIEITSNVIGAIVAVSMAALGFGYWSLICQNISLPFVTAILVWFAVRWIPGRPHWSSELHSMVRFGGTVTLNSLIVYVGYNAEKVLLGRFWGPAALGLYGRAFQLSNLPMQQLSNSVGSVAFPMLSRLQGDPPRLRRSYLKSHSLVVSLTIPVVISCAVFADEIIRVMLGPKWHGAAPILRLLAPAILVFALINPTSWLLRSTGRVGRSLHIAMVICPMMILGIVAGLHYGPSGVALGYSAVMVLISVPILAWAIHGTGITARDYWDCVKRPLYAGILGGACGWCLKYLCHGTVGPATILVLGLSMSFGVYVFFLLIVMGQKNIYVDIFRQIFSRGN